MKKETEGYFIIRFKNEQKYVIDSHPYCLPPYKTEFIDKAKPFETRTAAYKYMKEQKLDKDCIIEEIK